MEELDRAQERLENIRSVKPILGGLRTISLGSWQAAIRRKKGAHRYAGRLMEALALVIPHLSQSRSVSRRPVEEGRERVVALVVGSERGLCGRFNVTVVERAESYLGERRAAGVEMDLMALGSRVQRVLQRRDHEMSWAEKLSVTTLPPYSLAYDLTHRWLERYEEREIDAVDLIYNAYRGTGNYEPSVTRLIPPQMPAPAERPAGLQEPWPPTIIETDVLSLYARIVEQWAATHLYELLLDSAAAEHSTRFQLMESATQNAERLIGELTLAVQAARQKAITQEMQELAVGAGMIGPR
jgi:F-type H+-transporting ATPase subunit gamma